MILKFNNCVNVMRETTSIRVYTISFYCLRYVMESENTTVVVTLYNLVLTFHPLLKRFRLLIRSLPLLLSDLVLVLVRAGGIPVNFLFIF